MSDAPTICSYFLRGSCRFGNRCWNSHDVGSARSMSPLSPYPPAHPDDIDPYFTITRVSSPFENSSSENARDCGSRHVLTESAQKSSKTKTEPQSVWTLKNNNSGEIREGTPDSVLVEAVKKLNEAENETKTLRQQLRNKNEGDNFSWIEHQMEQSLENDFQCNICYEIFIKPTVLNCSHTFCHECIESWTRRVNHCPTCRVYVKNKSYCLTLETFLDKITDCLPDEVKGRRESLKVERNNSRVTAETTARTTRRSNNGRRRNNRNNSTMRRTLGVLWGERDRDGAEWNIALEEALFDPIRLGDVLGRNRDRDEWEDNLSDSSLESSEYGNLFCSYCDNIGHATSNCPLSLMEDYDGW